MVQRLQKLELYRYLVPFRQPLRLSENTLSCREVLLLKWQVESLSVWTEVAPLPGYSQENLSECRVQIVDFFKREGVRSLDVLNSAIDNAEHLYPSVEFGLRSVNHVLSAPSLPAPPICTLLTDGDTSFEGNPVCVKLKVGLGKLSDDIKKIQQLCANNTFTGKLRLDANQQWLPEDIELLSRAIDCQRIEWLEDPLAEQEGYRHWQEFSTIPFAYDETLYQHTEFPPANPNLVALVLKPSLLGYGRVEQLVQWAQSQDCGVVLSSAFESPTGMRALYDLAQSWAPGQVHGLDTLKYFPAPFRVGRQKEALFKEMDLIE
ncbi:enolase C-terminal domain-like protein [Teredinibacter haidensis]|uniref:enolase C-terminal domain-like protein n=1 Tax=Teredinibacter haidensis TaxID=2731755 RepID=UPI000AC460B3